MKIKNLTLQNYKRFVRPKTFSFCNSIGEVNEISLITGNNGTGKTSILQAIVLLVGTASRHSFDPELLDWPGQEYRHLQTGRRPLKIEGKILFGKDEMESTVSFANRLIENGVNLGGLPSELEEISVAFDYNSKKAIVKNLRRRAAAAAYYQFSGYQYAKRLASITPDKSQLFEKVGNIYWYNEQRNSYNLSNLLDNEVPQIDFIRTFLSSSYTYHQAVERGDRKIREGEFDFYAKLHELYKKVFPGRSFVGPSPRFDVYEQSSAPDFFLFDGRNEYEISGMSAGERAIFPILMDFARWNINHSIIIIDEIELHLHPPLQQSLIRALPTLGHNNQFIITSHSNYVASMFDEEENEIIRLPNV